MVTLLNDKAWAGLRILLFLCATQVCGASSFSVSILSSVNNEPPQRIPCVSFRQTDHCQISVLIEEKLPDGSSVLYSETECSLKLNEEWVEIRKWDQRPLPQPPWTIDWFKVEPLMLHEKAGRDPSEPESRGYTNAYSSRTGLNRRWIGYDKIEYVENRLPKFSNHWSIPADAHPTDPQYDINDGLGVMRYTVKVTVDEKTVATPGKGSVDPYGITDDVFKILIRRDDSYLGYVTSFFNIPGVFGSVPIQVNRRVGIDCADLVVSSWRRWQNKEIRYTCVNGLVNNLQHVTAVLYMSQNGMIYEDPKQETIARVPYQDGLVVCFDYPNSVVDSYDHVALLYADDGNGFVDGCDSILHCGPNEPNVVNLVNRALDPDLPTRLMILTWDGMTEEKWK